RRISAARGQALSIWAEGNAADVALVALKSQKFLFGVGIPDLDLTRLFGPSGIADPRSQFLAIGAVGEAQDCLPQCPVRARCLPTGHFPNNDRTVIARARQTFAVGAEGYCTDSARVSLECGYRAGRGVAKFDCLVLGAEGKCSAVGAEGDREDRAPLR